MEQQIAAFLAVRYGIDAQSISRMTTGVGGDTFRIRASSGDYVFKIVKNDGINHPEREAELCGYLRKHGVPASEFIPDEQGGLATFWQDGRVCHLQRLLAGHPLSMNAAPD